MAFITYSSSASECLGSITQLDLESKISTHPGALLGVTHLSMNMYFNVVHDSSRFRYENYFDIFMFDFYSVDV